MKPSNSLPSPLRPLLPTGPVKAGSKPNPITGKVRNLVERHPVETIEVLRRWLDEGDAAVKTRPTR